MTCPSYVAEAIGAETVTLARSQENATIAIHVDFLQAFGGYLFQRSDSKIAGEAKRVEDFELEHCVRS